MVKNNGRPPHTAITWDTFDSSIFPKGSSGRQWVEDLARTIDSEIKAIHDANMKAMYWFDIFVLPRTLADKYGSSIKDSKGQWSFDSKLMANITEYMVDAVFARFPNLDGLLIRTGEIYTQDVPYHVGGSPITDGYKSHIKLLQILSDVVLKKHKKLLFYRTWSFDGFTSDPAYYLNVSNAVTPDPNFFFVIKHTTGDYWRTVKFNPTLDIGKHPYLVEIQCQREYEGKGAFPNYIANGVIEGFEENAKDPGHHSLRDIVGSPLFKGVVTWARGGGWLGPYPADEFWIDMNVQVLSRWVRNPQMSEAALFSEYAAGLSVWASKNVDAAAAALRDVALLSAKGVLYGHYSTAHVLKRLLWTRDYYIGGGDAELKGDFGAIIDRGSVSAVLAEKALASRTWQEIANKTQQSIVPSIKDKRLQDFLQHSVEYGRLLYRIIETSWIVSLNIMAGNRTGHYDLKAIVPAIHAYDAAVADYQSLRGLNTTGTISSLYVPFGWGNTNGPDPVTGANHSVNT